MAAQKKVVNNNYSLLTSSIALLLGGVALGAALSLVILKTVPVVAPCATTNQVKVTPTPTKTTTPVKTTTPAKTVK